MALLDVGVAPVSRSAARTAAVSARGRAIRIQLARPGLAVLLLTLIVIVAFVASGVVGWTVLRSSRNMLHSQILASNIGATDLAAGSASRYVDAAQAALRETAARPSVIEALENGDYERLQTELVRVVQSNPRLSGVTVAGLDGTGLANGTGSPLVGVNLADRDYFRAVLTSGVPALGTPDISRVNGRQAVPYGAPIRDESGTLLGVLAGGISLDSLGSAIGDVRISEHSRVSLVDRRGGGVILAHADRERIMTVPDAANEGITQLLAGARGARETRSGGVDTLSVYAPVPGLPWGILIEEPSAKAFAPIEELAASALRLGVLAVVCALILGLPLAVWIHRFERRLAQRGEGLAGAKVRLEMELAERLRTEEALRTSEERFQLAARATNDAVWDRDVRSGTLAWTDAVYSLFGYAPGSVDFTIGWWESHLHPEDRERVIATPERALAVGEERWSREYRFLRADGGYAHVLDRGVIVRAADGTPTRMTGSVQDVSSRVRAERALLAANGELQKFAYTVSHDLKAPLVSIQGYATRLKEEYGTLLTEHGDGSGGRYLERLHANADRLSALITDVLEYSRLGQMDAPAEEVSLAGIVSEVTAALQLQLESSGGSVVVVTPLPVVHGVPIVLRQIIGNLIENGIKYGGGGTGTDAASPQVSIGVEEHATDWRVWVRDNGAGIQPELQDQVFRLFSRLPDGKRRDPNGTGVGLATVKRAVEQLGGTISIESDPSTARGTTFFVTLPKAPVTA